MAQGISSLLQNIFPADQRWKLLLFERWPGIVGRLKEHARIEKIYDATIIIGVSHPAWAQELHLLSPMLKKKINEVLGSERIATIRFQIAANNASGLLRSPRVSLLNNQKTSVAGQEHATLSAHEQKTIASLRDAQLQCHVTAYLQRCKRSWEKKLKG